MAQQSLNIGATADDLTGDTIRAGGQKINDNFTELYGKVITGFTNTGTALEIALDDGTIFTASLTASQNYVAFSGQTSLNITHDLGRFVTLFVIDASGEQIGVDAMHVVQTLNSFDVSFNIAVTGTLVYY